MIKLGRLVGRRAALVRNDRGAALVEFAVTLPFLLLLYLGGFQLSDNIARSRKVTIVTRTLADLVAQSASGTTSKAEVTSELAAASQVFAPYSVTPAQLRITEVYTDWGYNTTVQWSQATSSAAAYNKGAVYPLSQQLKVPGSYLLISEVSYAYVPPITYGLVRARTLKDLLIMLPRNSSSIDCGDC